MSRVLSRDRATYNYTSKWSEFYREIGQFLSFVLKLYFEIHGRHYLICFFVYLMKQELQELHSALEEAKADIVGLWALNFLITKVSWGIVRYSL